MSNDAGQLAFGEQLSPEAVEVVEVLTRYAESRLGWDKDRPQNYNIAQDVILTYHGVSVLRVSTAAIYLANPAACGPGWYKQIETFVFSDLKDYRTRQRIHCTEPQAIKFHRRIVRILREGFKGLSDVD